MLKGDSTEVPVRIGVIGAGYWGKHVIREIRQIQKTTGELELHSIADNSPTMLSQCHQEFGSLHYCIDYKSLLSDPTLDAVVITSSNSTHYEIASAFLQHEKSALVEKPMTTTSREANALVNLARQKKVVLSVGHIHRFNAAVRELKRAIANGALGELYYLRFRWTGFMLPQGERDVITDLAPHSFDICNYLLDMWPKTIVCRGKGFRTKEHEEVAFLTAEHSGELAAQIEVSWLDREKRRDVTVVGSKGTAYLDCSEQRGIIHGPDGSASHKLPIVPSNTLRSELVHFAECLGSNLLSKPVNNLCPGIQGAYVVRLLEAAKESLREKRVVPVVYTDMPRLRSSQSNRTETEVLLEPPLDSTSSPVWDPSIWDPDNQFADDVLPASVEARIRTSKHRLNIFLALSNADMGPTQLASKVGLDSSNLGKYLNALIDNGLVEMKTPLDLRKGRLYGLTEKGRKFGGRLSGENRKIGDKPQES